METNQPPEFIVTDWLCVRRDQVLSVQVDNKPQIYVALINGRLDHKCTFKSAEEAMHQYGLIMAQLAPPVVPVPEPESSCD